MTTSEPLEEAEVPMMRFVGGRMNLEGLYVEAPKILAAWFLIVIAAV
jgi:hypothetical protein